jgi:hypothetical protein
MPGASTPRPDPDEPPNLVHPRDHQRLGGRLWVRAPRGPTHVSAGQVATAQSANGATGRPLRALRRAALTARFAENVRDVVAEGVVAGCGA